MRQPIPIRSLSLAVWAGFLSSLFALAANAQPAPPMAVVPDRTNGIYQVGETVHWTVEWKGGTNIPAARYTLKSGGLANAGQGSLRFTNNVATLESGFDAPNTMLVEVAWQPENNLNRVWAGAVAAPGKIRPAAPAPPDFDEFWKARLADLAQVPANPQLEKVDPGIPNVAYWKITLDNIRGTHIQGQIARPETGEKFPALLILQYAGVYALKKNWVTDRAAEGWLTLNVEAHDIPIDQPDSFYRDLFAGALKNYWNIGNDDREASYYLRMYLSCVQALNYLKTRPDWDGRTIVVTGASQGGQQTLALAGLCPGDVTAAMVLVPAACDMLAPDAGRAPGFPRWYFNANGKAPEKVHEASRYYDPANFASRIKCPTLVALGLKDEELAPPGSILATANEITSPKEVLILSRSGHQNERGSQEPYNQRCYKVWLPALRQGKPAPVATTAP